MKVHAFVFVMRKYRMVLGLGDLAMIASVTIIGFVNHAEIGLSYMPRMLATFIPLLAAWYLLAPWFGLFDKGVTSTFKQIWRPTLAMILTAPLAAVLRAILLGDVVIPVFALVLGVTTALGISIWRALYILFIKVNSLRS